MKRVGLAILVLAALFVCMAATGKVFFNIATGGTAGTGGALAS